MLLELHVCDVSDIKLLQYVALHAAAAYSGSSAFGVLSRSWVQEEHLHNRHHALLAGVLRLYAIDRHMLAGSGQRVLQKWASHHASMSMEI